MLRVAAIAALSFAFFAGGSQSKRNLVGVAYFRQHTTTITHNGSFPGAVQSWRTDVILLHSPKKVGTGGIACIFVTNTARECFGTYILPEGRIKVIGEISNRTNYSFEITGGTGVYTGATGVARFTTGLVTFFLI